MRIVDFWLQVLTLIVYIVVSPILFGILYPTSGDVALIWIWVVVVTGITSFVSIIVFSILNVFVSPEKTYKIKVLIPLALSTFFMYNLGETPNDKMELMFALGNSGLLVVLYIVYGILFFKKIRSHEDPK